MGFPLIPLAIAGVLLVACTQVVKSKPNSVEQPLSQLAGSEWGPSVNSSQYVQFKNETELNGNGGCNRFGGSYELNGDRLIVGPLAMTKRACPELQAEQAFVKALQNTHHIHATHKTLTLYDDANSVLLELIRRDWD